LRPGRFAFSWEVWGLPVLEAAAAKKLIVAGPYPVLAEIRAAFRITVYEPKDVTDIAELLSEKAFATGILSKNQAAAQRQFDLRFLPDTLTELAACP
jgi:glycosyltransferase involved in cell wall biosynthesis